jgi:hypothetical protein
MAVPLPHFAAPFIIGRHGTDVVNQGSPGDLEARAYNVLVCPIGFREEEPEFGRPELLFKAIPLDTNAIRDAIERWATEPVNVTESGEIGEPWIRNAIVQVG